MYRQTAPCQTLQNTLQGSLFFLFFLVAWLGAPAHRRIVCMPSRGSVSKSLKDKSKLFLRGASNTCHIQRVCSLPDCVLTLFLSSVMRCLLWYITLRDNMHRHIPTERPNAQHTPTLDPESYQCNNIAIIVYFPSLSWTGLHVSPKAWTIADQTVP